jgi:serine/threonine-protein kinase
VGQGGQARIDIWKLKESGDLYAAKVYFEPSAELSEQIATEAMLCMQVDHPALVHGYDFFLPTDGDKSAVITMEDMAGGSLAAAIKGKKLNPTLINTTIISAVKGLEKLHSMKVLHRDLKPSNVLFTLDGFAKIGDFGSARSVAGGEVSQTKGAKTFFYSAPELHDDGEASEKSDVYALGLMFYEMLAGEPAFDQKLSVVKLIKIVDSAQRPKVPAMARPELVRVMEACSDRDAMK